MSSDPTYLSEGAALSVARGGLREAVKVLEDASVTSSFSNARQFETALRIVDHVATVLRHHVGTGSTKRSGQREISTENDNG